MNSKQTEKKTEKDQSVIFYKEPQLNTTEALQEELEKAFFANDWSLMRQLLVQGAFIDYRYDLDGKTLLFYCDSVDKIKKLVDMGADINAVKSDGRTLLGYSIVKRWSIDSIKLLLKYGAIVNAHMGWSPLECAVVCQDYNLELIKLLIEYKASFTCRCIPLKIGLMHNKNCAKMLFKYGVLHGKEDDCKKWIEVLRQDGLVYIEDCILETEDYIKACIAEVTLMKQELLDEEYSLYDYLDRSQNRILPFDSTLDLGKFPIYADIIQETIDRVTQRKHLLNEFNVVRVHTCSGKETVNLKYDEIFKISQHLDNDDLENLVSAFKI